MSFFDSHIVRAEIAEITILQEDIYKNIFKFPSMTIDEKKFHIQLLEKLLYKQKILYTRMSLSDDPDALEAKERIMKTASMMGFPPNVDINLVFDNMERVIGIMKNQLDTPL